MELNTPVIGCRLLSSSEPKDINKKRLNLCAQKFASERINLINRCMHLMDYKTTSSGKIEGRETDLIFQCFFYLR